MKKKNIQKNEKSETFWNIPLKNKKKNQNQNQ